MIDKLKFLIAIAQEKHFGRAAETCGVTQPTLSAGIKQLEEALGVMLVRRGSRFLGFTEEGERVLERARRIVADVRALKQDVESPKHGLTGHLRIAAVPTAMPVVTELTTPFHELHPNVRLTVLSRNSEDILQLLGNLEIDAGLTYIDNEPLGRVSIVPLYQEKYCLLTNVHNALADRKSVTWPELADLPLCLMTGDMQNRRIIDRNLRLAGVSVSAMFESNSMIALFAHIQTGDWAGIMPEKVVGAFSQNGALRAIPIVDPDVTYTIGLITGMRQTLSPLVSAMITQAKRLAGASGHSER